MYSLPSHITSHTMFIEKESPKTLHGSFPPVFMENELDCQTAVL